VIGAIAAATAAAIALGMAERTARRSEARARQLADQAQRGEAEAEVRLAEMWAAEGRRESARGSPLRALAYLGQSYGVVDGAGMRYAIARAMTSIDEERAVLRGHHSAVSFAYWSRDGRTIATSDEEESVKLWRFDGGQIEPAGQLGEHTGVLVGWSADGSRFGLGNEDGISIRSASTLAEVAHISGAKDRKGEMGGYFVHDGRSVVVWRKDGFIGVYDLDGRLLRHHQHPSGLYYAAVNHRGDRVAFVTMTGGLHFWEPARGRVRQILPPDFPVGDVELSDGGEVVVVGGADGQGHVFDFASGKRRHLLTTHAGRHPITVSRDGRWIATGGADRTAKLWDAASGRLVATMSEHRGPIGMLAFDPTGQQLATACGDGAVRVYNLRGVMLAAYEGHTADVIEVDWSPDGKWIASAAADGLAAVWPGRTPQTRELAGGDGELIDVLLCGKTIAIEHETELVLHDVAAERIARRIPLPEEIFSLACSPEAGRIAIGGEKGLRLLDLDGNPVAEIAVSKTPVGAIAFSRDGRSMATLHFEGGLRLWDAKSGAAGLTLMADTPKNPVHASAIEFAADGKALFLGDSSGHVAVWATDGSGELARRRLHQNEIMHLILSPDGSRLAAASSDRSLSIARTGDLELERTIEEHAAFITSIDWSDDGGLLVTGSADSSAYVWEVATGALVGEIRPGRGAVASALFAGDHIIAASRGGRVMSFPAHLERRSPEQIRQILSCRLPYRLTGSSSMERITPGEGCAQSSAAPAAKPAHSHEEPPSHEPHR
jgi:WD40 repeat protein